MPTFQCKLIPLLPQALIEPLLVVVSPLSTGAPLGLLAFLMITSTGYLGLMAAV